MIYSKQWIMWENKGKGPGLYGGLQKRVHLLLNKVLVETFQVEEKGWKGPQIGNSTSGSIGRERKW